jgi:hypothetical protein
VTCAVTCAVTGLRSRIVQRVTTLTVRRIVQNVGDMTNDGDTNESLRDTHSHKVFMRGFLIVSRIR